VTPLAPLYGTVLKVWVTLLAVIVNGCGLIVSVAST
jgi:hypothetical protein